jgi:hypothetical protein
MEDWALCDADEEALDDALQGTNYFNTMGKTQIKKALANALVVYKRFKTRPGWVDNGWEEGTVTETLVANPLEFFARALTASQKEYGIGLHEDTNPSPWIWYAKHRTFGNFEK